MMVPSVRGDAPLEYEVKAAFLYNFARFIDWPSEAFETEDSPLRVGVLGENPFGDALEKAVAGKAIDDRPVAVDYARRLEDLGNVHLLYVSESEDRVLEPLLRRLEGRSVLTVSDIPDFTQAGGMIRFVIQDRRVAFEINNRAAERAGLRISSRLLNVARVTRE